MKFYLTQPLKEAVYKKFDADVNTLQWHQKGMIARRLEELAQVVYDEGSKRVGTEKGVSHNHRECRAIEEAG